MPRQTRVFRVFVSSTFVDMALERRLLRERVFPPLGAFCRKHGATLQAVDLRWGVSDESQRNQATMEICLREIRRCQRLSPRPNFLILCGDRYGWQPLPSKIPVTEMEPVRRQCDRTDRALVDDWYRMDRNAIPTEYVLQPAGRDLRKDWGVVEARLRSILRSAAQQAGFSDRQLRNYVASATHREALLGALDCPPEFVRLPGHAMAFARKLAGPLPDDVRGDAYVDVSDGKRDEDAARHMANLRSALAATLGEYYIEYGATWNDGLRLDDAEGFVGSAVERLRSSIEIELAEGKSRDDATLERDYHRAFGSRLAERFGGRRTALAAIAGHVAGRQPRRLLAVLGPSGSGKSALMAKAATDAMATRAVVACRFIGADARSSNLTTLLGGLCREIAAAYDMPLEQLMDSDDDAELHDAGALANLFARCVCLSTAANPLILVLDALDQVSGVETSNGLRWLPTSFPDTTRIIVSALPWVEARLPGPSICRLSAMPREEAEPILDAWLASANRTLTAGQRDRVLSAFSESGLPLHLRLAFEEARRWRSYDAGEHLPATVPEMVERLFVRLERDHSAELVSKAVAYILGGRHAGLTEEEILGVLSFDEAYWRDFLRTSHPAHREEIEAGKTLPTVIWSRLHLDLEPYLTERDSYGDTLVGFYHRQFDEVLAASRARKSRRVHSVLADYFTRQGRWIGESRDHPNRRGAMELAWQLHEANRLQELKELLTDCDAMRAKLIAYDVDLLLGDYRLERYARTAELGLIRDALVLSSHVLRSDRSLHLSQIRGRLLGFAGNEWIDRLLATCASTGPLLTPLWPSLEPPGRALLRTFRGHGAPVSSVAMGHDGSYAVSASHDETLRVWDLETGAQEHALIGHDAQVSSIAIASDGTHIVSGAYDDTVRVWDRKSGQQLRTMIGHTDEVTSVAVTRDGLRAISGSNDGTVRIWNITTGAEEQKLTTAGGQVHAVDVTPDGSRVVAGSSDGTMEVWDLNTGARLRRLTAHASEVEAVVATEHDEVISGSMDRTVAVWDLTTGQEKLRLEGHQGGICALCRHPDGQHVVSGSLDMTIRIWRACPPADDRRFAAPGEVVSSVSAIRGLQRLVSGGWDGHVKLWDLEAPAAAGCAEGHTRSVDAVAIVPGGELVVSGSEDRSILVWDVATGRVRTTIPAHADTVEAIAITPDGRRIVSGSLDGAIHVWDLRSGAGLGEFAGHAATIYSIVVSSNGKVAVSGSRDHTVRMWRIDGGAETMRLEGHESPVNAVALTADEKYAVSGASDGRIIVWDLCRGRSCRVWKGHSNVVSSIALHDRSIVTGSWDGTIKRWDLASGVEIGTEHGPGAAIYAVAIVGGGRYLVSGSNDGSIRVWDLVSHAPVATYVADAPIMACSASTDGRLIAAGDGAGRVHALRFEDHDGRLMEPVAYMP